MRKTNKRFRHLVSSSGQRRKTDNRRKKEAEMRIDEKEATKLDQKNLKNEYVVQKDVIQMTCKKNIY